MVRRLLSIILALILANIALTGVAQERGYVGLELRDITAERARELRLPSPGGVLIVSTRRDGPAQRAGLVADDVILALDGAPVGNMAAALDYISSRAPGSQIKLSIWRGGGRSEFTATVARMPDWLALQQQIQGLTNQQKYAEVIPLAQRLVEMTRSDPGPRSAEHVGALDRLAGAYYALGKYSEAEPLYRSALAIREQTLPQSHPDTAWAHNRLGNALHMLGRYEDAIEQYRSMIAIMQTARGGEHDDVGVGFENLGGSLTKAGHEWEAVEALRHALAIREKALGPDHAKLLGALLKLGDALYAARDYGEAEPFHRRALAIEEKTLGPTHVNIGWAHNKLGNTLYSLRRYEEAIAEYRSMIAIMETARGSEHADVAVGLQNLGSALNKAGRHGEAVEPLRRAIAIHEKSVGPEHANLVSPLERLADALSATGQPGEAATVRRRAETIWDRTQPPPPSDPIPRIETGMHVQHIRRIGVDGRCRLMATGGDKTVRLWDVSERGGREPKPLHVLRVPIGPGEDGEIFAVALSPNGRIVAAGGWTRRGDHHVYIFDAANGQLVRRLDRLSSTPQTLAFSADGKFLAATLHDGEGMRAWETASWTLVGQDTDYGGEPSFGAAFDSAGNFYTVAKDGFLRRYGSDFKLEAKSKATGGRYPRSIAIHPKKDLVAVSYEDARKVDLYQAKDLAHVFDADIEGVNNGNLMSIAWSSDRDRLYAGGAFDFSGGRPVRIWDHEGRGKGRNVVVSSSSIFQLLPCADAIAVGAADPAFGLLSADGEKLLWHDSNTPDMRGQTGEHFMVSADAGKVRFAGAYGGGSPIVFNLLVGRVEDSTEPTSQLAPPDVASLKLTDWRNHYAPKLDGKPLALDRYEISRAVAVAPGANRFVLGTEWNLRAYDSGGKLVWRKYVPGVAFGVNVPRNGKYVVAAYGDGTVHWHRLSDGEEVLALFVHPKTREWVLWTPQGYYASAPAGDQYIGWHLNRGWKQAGEFVTAARLKQHLYRPDIVKRAFELADAAAAVREAGLRDFKIADLALRKPPQFHIVDPRDKAHADRSPLAVRIEVANDNDPVTAFDVKVNGRQVTPRAVRDLPRGAVEAGPPTLNIPLEKGENRIQVTARNDVGETVNELMVYLDREGLLDKKGRLFVLAIGVDSYSKLGLGSALRYAGADARLIVETLTQRAGPLHAEVQSKLLVSGGDMPPTKANIEDALLLFRDAKPEDTVILFLAGHGVNEGADYLFMPEDAQRTESGQWRPSSVVRWHVLQQALQEAQGKRVMFVDTCHSRGAFSPRLVKDAHDANIVVFSATDKDTLAQERSELGHGVFTYALSEGLKGGADFTRKGAINILQLGAFVSDEVKRLTNDEQEPTFNISQVNNFVLAAP